MRLFQVPNGMLMMRKRNKWRQSYNLFR